MPSTASTNSPPAPFPYSQPPDETTESPSPGVPDRPSGYANNLPPGHAPGSPGQSLPAKESESTLFPLPSQSKPLPIGGLSNQQGPQPDIPELSQATNEGPLWKYLGCFQDGVNRSLVGAQPLDYLRGDMSPITCVAHCGARGFSLAGVENGEECWCGRSIRGNTVRLPESCCEMPCRGNAGATCGGNWAIGVFLQVSADAASQPPA